MRVGSPLLTARALISLGGTAVEEGHLGAAQFFFDEAVSTARTAQLDFSLIRALLGRGETAGRHYESHLDLIRRNLDDEGFKAATAQGAQMSVEEAIAYAGRGRGARGERPKRGWEALTKAERDVLALVGEGLTNAEIAERLYISPRTVSTHLSHIHGKVGTTSRRELMRLAAQRANGNDE